MNLRAEIAVACESGGFRCVFVHGALDALEAAGIAAASYAAASASVLPAALAAVGRAGAVGIDYWRDAHAVRMLDGNGMSEMVLAGIEKYAPLAEQALFDAGAPRFAIAASEVVDADEAAKTQGELATRVGRAELIAMSRLDDAWPRRALRQAVFATREPARDGLRPETFRDAAYASTRMLHAWRIPASVDGRPYIDASYTVGFPVREAAIASTRLVIAIATSHEAPMTNLYRTEELPAAVGDAAVDLIAPACDLREVGVDFTTATVEGLERAYEMGRDAAERWVETSETNSIDEPRNR